MKDFEKVDWKQYNKPPYLQQWLCKDDTLKLATFGDKGLAEVDGQIYALKDQWDLDNAKGYLLDRIGKLLAEPRKGKDDGLYRLFLKLRTMLNTTDGSVNDVIKVIKYLYSSEVVQIVPDYPAGLIILHDGEGPDINFNAIIRQVVGAGIDYSTKELFYHTEEFDPRETQANLKSKTAMADYMAYVFHDGTYRHNGQIARRYNGVKDSVVVNITVKNLSDRSLGLAYHNGLFSRNGTIRHNGFVPDLHTELLPVKINARTVENEEMAEAAPAAVRNARAEWFEREFRRNGVYKHDGAMRHRANVIVENIVHNAGAEIKEQHRGLAFHNGMHLRNGAIKHGFMNDSITGWLQNSVKHGLNDQINAGDATAVSIAQEEAETLRNEIKHNGMYRRNGAIFHAAGVIDISAGNINLECMEAADECIETFTIGYREYRFRNGVYRHNGRIKHNANVFIPLG